LAGCCECGDEPSGSGAKESVFWDIAPRSLVETYRRFRDAYLLHHQTDQLLHLNRRFAHCLLIALIMQAVSTSGTLVNSYQTTYRNISRHLDTHRRQNLKSHLFPIFGKDAFSMGIWAPPTQDNTAQKDAGIHPKIQASGGIGTQGPKA
jgi:hypothetical protein